MTSLKFEPLEPPATLAGLRRELREFLRRETAGIAPEKRARSWSAFDPAFSRKLGAQGWIGMTWPRKYGGHERSALERYVVLEELLAAGAPVGAHWIADRQSGPLLMRFGSEAQRAAILPSVARGETYFCIGMSEPGAGSDLAAIRTRATPVDGAWLLNGQKIWTTHADRAHYMIALVRTSGDATSRHQGLSQFLIDLKSPGITIRPISDLAGEAHFSEVFFQDVRLASDCLIGSEGDGWRQVTAELALERSGPERYLSSYRLFDAFVAAAGADPEADTHAAIGTMAAELWTLRQMSMSVAGQLAAGRDPALEAAVVKDLGNSFEQELPRVVQALASGSMLADERVRLRPMLEYLLQASTTFSLRGGTREILRGIIARGLELR
jgi:alkylation response protein AidB-like acyl-CoA dehydrogenase